MNFLPYFFLFGLLFPASGALVSFSFSGTASGSIDSSSFSNLPFEIQLTADSNQVSQATPEVLQILGDSATITIGGSSAGSFLVGLRLFQSPFVSSPPGGPSGSQTLGLGLATGPDLLNLFHPAFVNYDLVSDLGPIFVAQPDFQSRLAFNDLPSELGSLTFTDTSNVTFSAAQIPEPSSTLFAVFGVSAFFVGRRRRAV